MLLRLAVLACATAVLAGCGGSKTADAPTSGLPPGCTVAETDGIIRTFLAHPTLAPPGFFQVYATYESDGGKFVTRKRRTALAHMRVREAAGEKLRLVSLRVAPQDFNHARATVTLTRFAPDFGPRKLHGRIARGAATIDCAHQKVAAWVVKGP